MATESGAVNFVDDMEQGARAGSPEPLIHGRPQIPGALTATQISLEDEELLPDESGLDLQGKVPFLFSTSELNSVSLAVTL